MLFREMIDRQIGALKQRDATLWEAVKVFVDQHDAHGVQDICIEIQAIRHSIRELEALRETL
jgi:hypothetical protein